MPSLQNGPDRADACGQLEVDSDRLSSPIRDLAGMFYAVSLTEAVRDTARDLMRFAPSERLAESPVLGSLAESYNRLRIDLAETMDPPSASALLERTSPLEVASTDVFSVYAASVTLVRLVGVVHKTPQFLLSEQVEASAAREITGRLQQTSDLDGDADPDAPDPGPLGAYL